jgi:hypothetical protein
MLVRQLLIPSVCILKMLLIDLASDELLKEEAREQTSSVLSGRNEPVCRWVFLDFRRVWREPDHWACRRAIGTSTGSARRLGQI